MCGSVRLIFERHISKCKSVFTHVYLVELLLSHIKHLIMFRAVVSFFFYATVVIYH